MAVYQGARRRSPLPLGLDALRGGQGARGQGERATVADDPIPAGRSRAAARAMGARRSANPGRRRSRPSSVGVALAAIVIVFGAAFLSLSQSVRVAATGYDIVRLVSENDRLDAIRQDLVSDVERLRSEPAIRKQALDAGLGQLPAPIVLSAR
jgi:cell division protein FtsB